MPRPLRIEIPGGRYHVTARGNERRAIYRDDRDRAHFLELLGTLPARFGTVIHAYVLMENHYHLVVEVPEGNLTQAVQWLNVSYSVWFNRRHERTGHLFQGRFKSHLIEDNEHLADVARYVHLNPVRTGRFKLGKAERAARRQAGTGAPESDLIARRLECLRDYRWSSYPAYRGSKAAPEWLTTTLVGALSGGRSAAERREAWRRYVEAPIRDGVMESPWDELVGGAVLGSKDFYLEALAMVEKRSKDSRGSARRVASAASRTTWDRIVQVVESAKDEKWEAFCNRYGDWGRDAALYLGRQLGRLTLVELGQRAGGLPYPVVGAAISRMAKRLKNESGLRKSMEAMKAQL